MIHCKGCGADIEFVVSKTSGKLMPVDVESKQKRVAVVSVTEGGDKEVRMLDTYISHHATCPNVADFRKP